MTRIRPLLLVVGLAFATPAMAQLVLPPPVPKPTLPPKLPSPPGSKPTTKTQSPAQSPTSPFKRQAPAAPSMTSLPMAPPLVLAPTEPTMFASDKPAAVPGSGAGFIAPPALEVVPEKAKEEAPKQPSSFTSREDLRTQRKPCQGLTFPTVQWKQAYGEGSMTARAITKASVNCLLAVQPSENWITAAIGSGNTVRLEVATNNTTSRRTGTVMVATPWASFELTVDQAGNPSEFLPL